MHTTLLQHTDGGNAQVTHILRRTQAKSPLDWFWIKMNRKKKQWKKQQQISKSEGDASRSSISLWETIACFANKQTGHICVYSSIHTSACCSAACVWFCFFFCFSLVVSLILALHRALHASVCGSQPEWGNFDRTTTTTKFHSHKIVVCPKHKHTAHVSVRFRFQWRIHTQQERTHSQNPHKAHSTVHTRHIIRLYETKIGKHTAQRHSAEHDVRNKNWNVYWTHTASKFTLCVVLSFDKWLRRTDTILANIGRFKRTHNTHKQHVLAKTESVSQSVTD